MKPTSDSRYDSQFDSRFDTNFDANYAVQMLLDAAQELSLEGLLKKLVTRAVARPDIAFAQVQLLDKADGCLHLAMADGSVPPNFTDSAASVPGISGIFGEVLATGQRVARRKSDPDWKQLADPAWLERERIESFAVLPIAFKDEVLGVVAAFLRHAMLAESLPFGAMLASYIGVAVVNTRAF